MDHDHNSVLQRLGATLRGKRKGLGLTLVEVASSAGLSAGFLSQAERGLVAPSLSSLRGLARALDLPLSWLLSQPEGSDRLTRQGERVHYGPDPSAFRYERISAAFPGHVLNGVLIHESPGHRSEPIRHEGEELFYVLQGELTVELGGRPQVLTAGDSLHFPSSELHSTWNHTTGETIILHVCTMAVFDDTHTAFGESAVTATAQAPFAALHRDMSAVVPIRLFTITALDRAAGLSRRLYTSHPADYPVTGTKPIGNDDWSRLVIGDKQTFVANRTADFAPYFPDHAQINALGCQSAVNIPVIDKGMAVATINLLDVENHFTPERVAALKALVAARTGEIVAAIEAATSQP